MEIILIVFLVGLLGFILYLAYSFLRWIVKEKLRYVVFLSLAIVLVLGISIHQLFFEKMEFIQSQVYPELYLIKDPSKAKGGLHQAIQEKTLEHLRKNLPEHEVSTLATDYSIKFYEYTRSWSINLFADAGTSYFLENEEDLGGFVVEDLGMYSKQLLASFQFLNCNNDTNSPCGELSYFNEGQLMKTDTLHQIFPDSPLRKKQDTHENVTELHKIRELQNAFTNQDELQFLKLFPSNFSEFKGFFGWNEDQDKPEKLYQQSTNYITYFFQLIKEPDYQKFDSKLIAIAKNGKWQADAVNHFQDQAMDYIKQSQRYNLINELEFDEAKSVLFFLFDGPHPQVDFEFTEGLNNHKMHIVNDLFAHEIQDWDHNEPMKEDLKNYLENEHFFIRDIDINKDMILDKVVSAVPYQGDELLLFVKKSGNYEFALKTSNFSQDGGNQIVDIKAHQEGIIVLTAFPDRGFSQAEFYITFKQDQWILSKTVYRERSGNQADAAIQVCEVLQDLDLSDPDLYIKLKPIPEEGERSNSCVFL
ncbi:hypothetical protein SYJ56_18800 [Algoriphagus sp. D3-2-R+10]|uniref:hypothetical protein n=1 Tax=Algoriphagus aurantiacus TaxID=3103948 RepID=UPI002B3FBDFA|nr:hypothetical protein [Algoriphagus sp. D3-2-R+10]MEB2777371.1 hypothetical protein [Algoriphagus sp. D3-2-R+10]